MGGTPGLFLALVGHGMSGGPSYGQIFSLITAVGECDWRCATYLGPAESRVQEWTRATRMLGLTKVVRTPRVFQNLCELRLTDAG